MESDPLNSYRSGSSSSGNAAPLEGLTQEEYIR